MLLIDLQGNIEYEDPIVFSQTDVLDPVSILKGDCPCYITEAVMKNNKIYIIYYDIFDCLNILHKKYLRKVLQCVYDPSTNSIEISCESGILLNDIDIFLSGPTNYQINDKLLQINEDNLILIGLNDYFGLIPIIPVGCYNAILWGDADPTLTYVGFFVKNCDYLPSSYTTFVLLFSDNRLINIGLQYLEKDKTCGTVCVPINKNTYITIIIYSRDLQNYLLPKTQIFFSSTEVNFINDAIVSMDDSFVYLLADIGKEIGEIINIFPVKVNPISSISTVIYPITVQRMYYTNNCTKIHEYSFNKFILHCLSNSYYNSNILYGPTREIIYIIEKYQYGFRSILYKDNFYEKYFKISSSTNSNLNLLLGISKDKSFSLGIFDSAGTLHTFDPITNENITIINQVKLFSNKYFLGGCSKRKINDYFYALMYIFDSNNNFVTILYINSQLNSCLKGMINFSDELLIISVANNIDDIRFSIKLLGLSNSGSIVRSKDSLTAYYEECPLLINSNNNVLLLASLLNQSTNFRYPSLIIYDEFFNNLGQFNYLAKSDVVSNNIILNQNDEPTFGGGSIIRGESSYFWVAHFNFQFKLISNIYVGQAQGKSIASSQLNNRLHSFSGYINCKFCYYSFSSWLNPASQYTIIITDQGNHYKNTGSEIWEIYYDEDFYSLFSSSLDSENSIQIFGIVNDFQILSRKLLVTSDCPDATPLHDVTEYGCFKNCLSNVQTSNIPSIPNTIQCNNQLFGCNPNSTISYEYMCVNDSLIAKVDEKQSDQYVSYLAEFVNEHEIEVVFNQTLSSNCDISNLIIQIYSDKIHYKKATSHKILLCSKSFFRLKINFIEPSELYCAKNIFLIVAGMNFMIYYLNIPLIQDNFTVTNLEILQCPNQVSQFGNFSSQMLDSSLNYASGFSIGTSFLSFNPFSFILLANCFSEIMTFQLINEEPFYPMGVNTIINTTSIFSLNFLPDIFSYFPSLSLQNDEKDNNFLENNINNHPNLQSSSSFLRNFTPIFTSGILSNAFFLLLYLFTYSSKFFRVARNNMNKSIFYIMYQSVFYSLTITSIASINYENQNFDIFSFLSKSLSFIILTLIFLIPVIYVVSIYFNKSLLGTPEIEEKFGNIYEGFNTDGLAPYSLIKDTLKISILILIPFFIQGHPQILLIVFIIVYSFSFVWSIFCFPYDDCRYCIQAIIKEGLFLGLIFILLFYNRSLKNPLSEMKKILEDLSVLIILLIVANEFLFSLIDSLIFFFQAICEESIKGKVRFKFKITNIRQEIFFGKLETKFNFNFNFNFNKKEKALTEHSILNRLNNLNKLNKLNRLNDLNNLNNPRSINLDFENIGLTSYSDDERMFSTNLESFIFDRPSKMINVYIKNNIKNRYISQRMNFIISNEHIYNKNQNKFPKFVKDDRVLHNYPKKFLVVQNDRNPQKKANQIPFPTFDNSLNYNHNNNNINNNYINNNNNNNSNSNKNTNFEEKVTKNVTQKQNKIEINYISNKSNSSNKNNKDQHFYSYEELYEDALPNIRKIRQDRIQNTFKAAFQYNQHEESKDKKDIEKEKEIEIDNFNANSENKNKNLSANQNQNDNSKSNNFGLLSPINPEKCNKNNNSSNDRKNNKNKNDQRSFFLNIGRLNSKFHFNNLEYNSDELKVTQTQNQNQKKVEITNVSPKSKSNLSNMSNLSNPHETKQYEHFSQKNPSSESKKQFYNLNNLNNVNNHLNLANSPIFNGGLMVVSGSNFKNPEEKYFEMSRDNKNKNNPFNFNFNSKGNPNSNPNDTEKPSNFYLNAFSEMTGDNKNFLKSYQI